MNIVNLNRLLSIVVSLFCLAFFTTLPVHAAEEHPGPNANLLRQASGHYEYRTLTDGRLRGVEEFQLLVHRDGSRTLMFWHDLWAKNAQFSVVLRVDQSFRPLTAFLSYWVENGYKGNATIQVAGDQLRATANGPNGVVEQAVDVPDRFSIGTHPVSGDGWHLWYVPTDESGHTGAISLYSLEATADLAKAPLGTMIEMPYEYLGEEVVETPAGQFESRRYRLMGSTDMWISGPDRILVRMTMEKFDRDYVLTEFASVEY